MHQQTSDKSLFTHNTNWMVQLKIKAKICSEQTDIKYYYTTFKVKLLQDDSIKDVLYQKGICDRLNLDFEGMAADLKHLKQHVSTVVLVDIGCKEKNEYNSKSWPNEEVLKGI